MTLPIIKPYKEALDFQRKRTALHADDFYDRALDAARPRAFTVTGLQRMDLLLAANRLVEEKIATNMTMSDFADLLGEVADQQAGLLLSPSRLELIHHNAVVTATANGQWREAMEFVEDRPYFKYFGPRDGRNSRICKPISGIIVHYTHPILKHMWHPNHHRERHEWISLSAEEVNPKDVYEGPDGFEYPVVDGRLVRPGDGWDFNAAENFGADDSAFIRAIDGISDQLPAKTPADYGLEDLTEIPLKDLPAAPKLARRVRASIDDQWRSFREVFGIAEAEQRTIVLDYANDGVWLNRATFEHLVAVGDEARADKQIDRARHFVFLRETLRSPAEVWLVRRQTASGETVFTKRYIGMFRDDDGKRATLMFFERSPEGWLMDSGRINKTKTIDRYRHGLLVFTRAGRKG